MIQTLDRYLVYSDLAMRAGVFCIDAHGSQTRRYTGEMYWKHPHAIATRLVQLGAEPEVIAAAMLHDTLEDTEATPEMIEALFGARVLRLVLLLTDSAPVEGGPNRKARKAATRQRYLLVQGQDAIDVHSIKCLDLADNWPSIRDHDPAFAKVYREEVLALVGVLVCADSALKAELLTLLGEDPSRFASRDPFTINAALQAERRARHDI